MPLPRMKPKVSSRPALRSSTRTSTGCLPNRASGSRVSPAGFAITRRARVDFPAVGDWVVIEPPVEGADARIAFGAAAQEPFLTPRGGRSDRRADRRRQYRHRVPRVRARRRLQPRGASSATCSSPADSGATPVVVLNKTDLVEDIAGVVREVQAVAAGRRCPCRVMPRSRDARAAARAISDTDRRARCSGRPASASRLSSIS